MKITVPVAAGMFLGAMLLPTIILASGHDQFFSLISGALGGGTLGYVFGRELEKRAKKKEYNVVDDVTSNPPKSHLPPDPIDEGNIISEMITKTSNLYINKRK